MSSEKSSEAMIPLHRIENRIVLIRGERVMLANDLAALYGVATKALNQAVKRNIDRFPDDFMFQLTKEEHEVVANCDQLSKTSAESRNLRSQIVTSSWGGARRALPYAFTEHGVIMAANLMRSPRAVQVSIYIVRAFVKLREVLSTHKELSRRLDELERKVKKHDGQIVALIEAIRQLMNEPATPRKPIGFQTEAEERKRVRAVRRSGRLTARGRH
jgi:hypothetical protein